MVLRERSSFERVRLPQVKRATPINGVILMMVD